MQKITTPAVVTLMFLGTFVSGLILGYALSVGAETKSYDKLRQLFEQYERQLPEEDRRRLQERRQIQESQQELLTTVSKKLDDQHGTLYLAIHMLDLFRYMERSENDILVREQITQLQADLKDVKLELVQVSDEMSSIHGELLTLPRKF